MLRCTVALLGLVLAAGCTKTTEGPTLQPAAKDSVEDQGATFDVDVRYQPKGADEVEIVVKMTATGIEQTDKLVVDVSTHGFVITEGTPEWAGFIQPREKYTHRVTYKLLDDADSGRATVSIRRSLDSTLLWDAELLFEKGASGVQLAG